MQTVIQVHHDAVANVSLLSTAFDRVSVEHEL